MLSCHRVGISWTTGASIYLTIQVHTLLSIIVRVQSRSIAKPSTCGLITSRVISSIHPFRKDINGLGEWSDACLKGLTAYSAAQMANTFFAIHLHRNRFVVMAEETGECCVYRASGTD